MKPATKSRKKATPELGLELAREWMRRHARPPDPVPPLFHYTGAGGIRGIIRSDRLWASGAQYMNDWMEVVYGFEIIMKNLRELVESRKLPERSQQVFTEVLRLMNEPDSPFVDAYFVAFCEKGNLLSQWRAYAGTQGFAAEFDPLVLKGELTLTTNALGRNLRLAKVEYDPRKQDKGLQDLISELTDTIETQVRNGSKKAPGPEATVVEFARVVLSSWAATVKHPGFEEEQEWRVIFQPLITAEERYLSTQEFAVRLEGEELVSHVEFMPNAKVAPKRGKEGPKLPIKSITCGPNVAMRSAMRALEILLRNNGYESVEIRKSEIPARS
ncbi:MAG TPA: DUF2971 domain-containing protein [Terriglobales bacterium]|nr:DUF2971 domain-containing protein [Terriglobales bacterium]